ncbi:S-adenosyl-L-methionine-dependent methyltransferase [Phakopsora pachyrhizi]|nr:S-adenosyl-L-methionine-dependent methyltransferase [Phakopsora pachyrhizi]
MMKINVRSIRPMLRRIRLFSSSDQISSTESFKVFDRSSKLRQISRSLIRNGPDHNRQTDYLRKQVSVGLVDRLLDIRRRYDEIVEFGSGAGYLLDELYESYPIKKLTMTDRSEVMLWRDRELDPPDVEIERIQMDEESVSFENGSKDCIVSCLSLHWVNDLPGTLIQIKNSLKPNGVFIGAMLGGDSLFELRTSLQLAEQERLGGISPRVSPMTDSRSMSSLINRTGFKIPTIDNDEITVRYPSMFELMDDLRSMGESNSILNRKTFLRRDTILAASSIYNELYGSSKRLEFEDENFKDDKIEVDDDDDLIDENFSIPATFQVIYFIGWKDDDDDDDDSNIKNDNNQLESIDRRGLNYKSFKELGESSEL